MHRFHLKVNGEYARRHYQLSGSYGVEKCGHGAAGWQLLEP
jgi:hypothetical protein